MKPTVNITFPHTWTATILDRRPLILPSRQFFYPRHAEEVERGALEVAVKPAEDNIFLATCALGFADPAAPSGIWSCPNPDALCAMAGGYAYLIDTTDPARFAQIEYRPVLIVRPVPSHGLLLFAGHHSIMAWGRDGVLWQSDRLSSEGLSLDEQAGDLLHGMGWELKTDRDVPFALDLRTGHRNA